MSDPLNAGPLRDVLNAIYLEPKKLQSNFCRDNSHKVASLASLGFITTRYPANPEYFGFSWRITWAGLRCLENT